MSQVCVRERKKNTSDYVLGRLAIGQYFLLAIGDWITVKKKHPRLAGDLVYPILAVFYIKAVFWLAAFWYWRRYLRRHFGIGGVFHGGVLVLAAFFRAGVILRRHFDGGVLVGGVLVGGVLAGGVLS